MYAGSSWVSPSMPHSVTAFQASNEPEPSFVTSSARAREIAAVKIKKLSAVRRTGSPLS